MREMSDTPRAVRRRSWVEAAGVTAIVAAVVWFYAYLATSHMAHPFKFNQGATDYYHHLVAGFMEGQLSMTISPDPELATLADPYDPLARVQIGHPGLADASYYKGRYYLYFGVAPAVAFFLPFRLLTGLHFPEALACALFCAGGYLASLALILGIRRRYFPDCPAGIVWLGTLMLGLGNFCVVMLTRAQFYEVPIASAYFFSCLGLWGLFRAMHGGLKQQLWLWGASAAFGLAVASRPHFVFACVVLAGMGLWRWCERRRAGAATWSPAMVADAFALMLPVALTLVGLFAYNYLRFDSPFEFGQRYQLGGSNVGRMKLLSWTVIPANLYYYFWAPAQFTRYFPFFDIIRDYPGTRPQIYYGIEDPFGLLPNMPCFWLTVLAPVMWWVHHRARRELGVLILFLGVVFATVCLFTLFFVSATNRDMVDFLPSLLLVAAIGLLMVSHRRDWARGWRWTMRAGLGLIVVYTAFFNVMAAFQHNDLFRRHQPAAFDRIGRWFNQPASWWERLAGYKYGPVELTVKLSHASLGTSEPLVVTGNGIRSDFVYLYYSGSQSIQVGFSHMGSSEVGILSQPIPLDYDIPHRIGVQAGSLYPPSSHSYFSRFSSADIEAAKHTLRVTVDGVPYVEATHSFYDASPGFISFGRNHVSGYAGREFKGQLLEVRRQPLAIAIRPFTGGSFVRMAFNLPSGQTGRREPLIATGEPGAGDLLFIAYEDDSHVRIGFQHAGSAAILSEPLEVQAGQIQRFEASLGSFYPSPQGAEQQQLSRALVAKLNDRLIWIEEMAFYPSAGKAPVIGLNSLNSDACAPAFSGKIVAVQPTTPMAMPQASRLFDFKTYWLESAEPGYGPLRLQVDFPRDQVGKFEPLLVTGPTVGQADYVWIQYVDANRTVIGYEHTSGGGPREVIPAELASPHVIELHVPSLYPPVTDAYFDGYSLLEVAAMKTHVRIKVDGVMRIDARVKAYESTPAQATPGENRLSTTFGQRFTGRIRRSERGTFASPPGFLEQNGPLEIVLTWPEVLPVGTREVLVATGTEAAADALLVSYEDATHMRLVMQDHQGIRRVSEPLAISAAKRQTLRVTWGGFNTAGSRQGSTVSTDEKSRLQRVRIRLDGTEVMAGEVDFMRVQPQGVWIGGAVPTGGAFSGLLHSVRRLAEDKP